MYDVIAIANFFIKKGIETQNYVTQMKLQKLIYFAHGWYLALKQQPLIDSSIEAWEFGPVIPTLYHQLKSFGNKPITALVQHKIDVPIISPNDDVITFLDAIWRTYSPLHALQLSDMTHEAGTPWDLVAKKYNYSLPKNKDIEDNVIRDYFQNQKDSLEQV